MALQELGIATDIVTTAFAILFGAIALALGACRSGSAIAISPARSRASGTTAIAASAPRRSRASERRTPKAKRKLRRRSGRAGAEDAAGQSGRAAERAEKLTRSAPTRALELRIAWPWAVSAGSWTAARAGRDSRRCERSTDARRKSLRYNDVTATCRALPFAGCSGTFQGPATTSSVFAPSRARFDRSKPVARSHTPSSMTAPNNRERILPRLIDDEIKESFINYSMSVIVSRALPDVRDGLKPVHRRVLYAMYDTGLVPGRPYKKSRDGRRRRARQVSPARRQRRCTTRSCAWCRTSRCAIRSSTARGTSARSKAIRAAAYRYTEARLMPIAMEMLADIDKNTVDFVPNFDDHARRADGAARRAFRTSSSTDRRASRSAWRRTFRRTTCARSSTRSSQLIDNPDATFGRHQKVHQGSRLPDGRLHLRPRRHQGLSGDGTRTHRHARARGDRGEGIVEQGADRRHRNSVSGQQREARSRTSPTWFATRSSKASPTCATSPTRRHAHRHRAQARRDSARGAQSALQAHRDAVDVRRHHARAGARRADGQPRAEGDAAQGSARALHRAPPRSHRPPHAVRPRQGARARAHPRRPQDRRRQHRRGHQGHSRGRRTRRRRARSCRSASSSPSGRPRRSSTCGSPSSPASRSRSSRRS